MPGPRRAGAYSAAITAIWDELADARARFRPLASLTEALWVIAEEVDELWEAVRADDTAEAIAEATQVAAMAVRLVAEAGPRRDTDREFTIASARLMVQTLVVTSRDERPAPCASLKEGYGLLHRHYSRLLKAVEDDRADGAHNHALALAAATTRFVAEARHCPPSERKASAS